MNLKELKKNILDSNSNVKKEYGDLELEYDIIKQLIQIRIENKMSQKDLAKLIGTKQSNISRIENGKTLPSLTILSKMSKALNKELKVTIK